MKNRLLKAVEQTQVTASATYTVTDDKGSRTIKREIANFQIGDTVVVHQRILEGGKERLQTFEGVVIGRKGEGLEEMFTVRRIVQGEGVERVFPLHSPRIAKLDIKRTGEVRRAKLYYLRDRVGKATRLRERKEKVDPTAAAATAAKKKAKKAEKS